jgi:tryptophan synthase alpha chain
MSRITDRFRAAKATGRGALVPYVTAGFPSMDATVEIACALADAGADVLELGVPFSDPVADGPVIQRASEAALAAGATLERCLDAAGRIRARRPELAVVLFSYYNPLLQLGLGRLGGRLAEAGVDGVLVTDVVPEEGGPLVDAVRPRGVDTIFLAAPTSSDERLRRVAAATSGFVYAVSRTGVTGAGESMADSARRLVERVRTYTDLPVAVGFGVSSAEHVAEVWSFADAAVVGSRLVAEIAAAREAPDVAERAGALLASLVPVVGARG